MTNELKFCREILSIIDFFLLERSSICGFLRGIISTVDCVSSIFTGETLLKVLINKLSSPDSEPSLALIGNMEHTKGRS